MSKIQGLRDLITARLTAAVEEIFTVFEKTIVEYEEEIERQRRLLELVLKPDVKLHRIEDLPQQYVGRRVDVNTYQQLGSQEEKSGLDQAEPVPAQIKVELDELFIIQDVGQLVLKKETENVKLIPTCVSDHIHPNPNKDPQLLCPSSPGAGSQDQELSKHADSESTRTSEPLPEEKGTENTFDNINTESPQMPKIQYSTYECDFCEKTFDAQFSLRDHLKIHTGEKPYVCNICGKGFGYLHSRNIHLRVHAGKKTHVCNICGERFNEWCKLRRHRRIHTEEKPKYFCTYCKDGFYEKSPLINHMKIHERENDRRSAGHSVEWTETTQ